MEQTGALCRIARRTSPACRALSVRGATRDLRVDGTQAPTPRIGPQSDPHRVESGAALKWSGCRYGDVRQPLQLGSEEGLLLRDERVLPALLGLFIEPDDGALTFTVELGLHGALLRLIHRAHVIRLLRNAPFVTLL